MASLLCYCKEFLFKLNLFCHVVITVVPAFSDSRLPPDMYGHVINVPIHPNVKLPAIGGHLPNADSQLLVVLTCYNGQFKQMLHFRWSFQSKIARGAHLKLRPTVRSNSNAAYVPSGDRKQCFISQTLWLHSFYDITSSASKPRCRRRERFLVLTNAHRVEHVLSRWCGKTQIARIKANRVATKCYHGRVKFGRPA